ncbi:MAG TPA: hypothetical protein PKD09_04930 [Aggregatilinea sp.]|uniref:hypothetical protein n=1 Tax=Aggregatilinea sp. TaxID=2806333 RepID=UPI002B8B0193|nr:hypothetical protein [Aggregatilinea sp.]HML20969.1 hypothetical protein [Aggregatilinea sp.]
MAVQLDIPYETLVTLVEQLSEDQKIALLRHLQGHTEQKPASAADKKALLRAAQLHLPVNEEPSPRREDWYDDDDR